MISRFTTFVMMRTLLPVLSLVLVLGGCSKDEIIVPDNVAPPDHTIPTVILENYVTKAYIGLLGRKPSDAEHAAALAIIANGGLDTPSRISMLTVIMQDAGYRQKIIETNSFKLLNGYDTAAVSEQIYTFDLLLANPDFQQYWPDFEAQKARMVALRDGFPLFLSGQIDVVELHRRLIDNNFYDQINMGTENYVRSSYNHFYNRNPTTAELEQGTLIVDGLEGIMFGQLASNKDGYNQILLGSDEYLAGQVRELFIRYLFREPDSEETVYFSIIYESTGNYDQLQREILSLNEYIGL